MSKKAVTEEKAMKKTTAFRLVVGELGINAEIPDIVAMMKDKYGVEMDKNMASTYRSNLRKKDAEEAGSSVAAAKKGSKKSSGSSSNDVIDFMTEIREWESKLTPDMIQKLVKVMYHA